MKKMSVSFDTFKCFDEYTLADYHELYDDLFDELMFLNDISMSFVENEDDLLQFTSDACFNSVYDCALDLISCYGTDRGKALLLSNLGFISSSELGAYIDALNASIAFLKRYLLSSAIWKEV